MKKIVCLLIVVLAVALLQVPTVLAAPAGKVKSLAKRYRNLDRKTNRLVTRFNRLSSAQQARLLSRLAEKYDDADNDDLPDFLDTGAGRCDSDVDDDGILDGEDRDDDSGDDDSDDSSPTPTPTPSGNEIEIHAVIQSIGESSITLNNTTFVLNNSTEYLDDDNNEISRTDFSVGECVEVEGFSSGGNLVAEKVKEDDDC
ncbi:DUF5666 domain-containing protein [bacterium]|nr:DUF5666 domain-containing protein [bacterium]